MNVLLIGGTDLTIAVGDRLRELGVGIGGVVYVGDRFDISYAPDGVTSSRAADIRAWAEERGVASHEYRSLDDLARVAADDSLELAMVAGWYHLIPRRVRERFARGCVGVHASLLPRLRGGAPLTWAILRGHTEAGVSLFALGDGIDDGPVYGQRAFPIPVRATIGELLQEATTATLELVGDLVPALLDGRAQAHPQEGAPSYGLQRRPEDGVIDWRLPTLEIDALVRAVGHPYPGARTSLDGRDVCIWTAEPAGEPLVHGTPGQVAVLPGDPRPRVVTGDGSLLVHDATIDGASALDTLRAAAHRRLGLSG